MHHAPRTGLVALAVLAAACGASPDAPAASRARVLLFEPVERLAAGTDAVETTPALGRRGAEAIVVYATQRWDAGGGYAGSRIWYQRLLDGVPADAPVLVSGGATEDQLDDVSGDTIVYTAWDSSGALSGEIVVYDIPTATRTALARAEVVREAKVAGGKVAWIQGAPGAATLWLQDLSLLGSGAPAAWIAGPTPSPADVELGDRFLVWDEMFAGGQRDVRAYDLAARSRRTVASLATVDERFPSTDGPWIAWEARPTGGAATRLELLNADTGERRVVADGGALNWAPSVSGDLVAYESQRSGDFDVYAYRISTGETLRVTADPLDQRQPSALGDLVAYVDARAGSEDVWVSRLAWVEEPCPPGAPDADGDGACDAIDVCPALADPAQADADADGAGDACDPCPQDPADAPRCGAPLSPMDAVFAAMAAVRALPAGAFDRAHLQDALLAKLAAARHMAAAGAYRGAATALAEDVLAKTDGCALAQAPDANDWVVACDAQGPLAAAAQDAVEALARAAKPAR